MLRHQRLDERSLEELVELGRELREAFNRGKIALVVAAVVVGENVGEGALVAQLIWISSVRHRPAIPL